MKFFSNVNWVEILDVFLSSHNVPLKFEVNMMCLSEFISAVYCCDS